MVGTDEHAPHLTSGQEAPEQVRAFDLGPQAPERPILDFESAF
jgi:hypothetical protein